MKGLRLVAYVVENRKELDPTSALYPRNTQFPETYIWVQWVDSVWTWESREDFRYIIASLTEFQVDIILYYLANT